MIATAITPKLRRKIVVHSLPDLEDGALAVLAGLVARGHRPIVLRESPIPRCTAARAVGAPIREAWKNSLRGVFHFLTAGTVITTHGVFTSHHPPKRQRVVNIWHGESLTGSKGRWDGDVPGRTTYATAMSNVDKAFRCAEFGLPPEQVMVVGAPRNDRMFESGTSTSKLELSLGTSGKKVLLWLPDYRRGTGSERIDGGQYSGGLPLDEESVAALDTWLVANDVRLVIKLHPLAPKPGPGRYKGITVIDSDWLVSQGFSLIQLLNVSDCLITDGSSVWIDYLLLDRPMIFHLPNPDTHPPSRTLHRELYEASVPGPLTKTGDDLISALDTVMAARHSYASRRKLALSRLHRHQDGNSTARLLDYLEL